MGHAQRHREDQPKLAVWCLLNGVDTLILHLGVFRQCLRGGDWLLDVNLSGLKFVSQGAGSFRNLTSSLRRCGIGILLTVGGVLQRLYLH